MARVILLHVSLLVTIFCGTATGQDKIKIGLAAPLSGPAASYGTDVKNGVLFADKLLGGGAYEFIIEDDHCSDKEAVNIAQKFVNVDRVKFVLGFGCSGTVLAAAPVYEKGKVIAIASGTGAPKISYAGDYIFRTKPSLSVAGQKLFADMQKRFRKVGLITEETAYAQGLTDAVLEANTEGAVDLNNENYLPGTRDFRALLLKFKSKGAQALFLNTQAEDTIISLYKQILALNWDVQIYGTFHPGSRAFLDTFGPQADGVIYADTPFNDQMLNAKGQKVYGEFVKEYGAANASEHFVTLSYASFAALHDAIQSGEDVKDYLYTHTFSNIVDSYSFDENGDVVSDKITYVLKQIKDGRSVPYQ